jgi:DNA-binding GntR family transcriptional regulator
MPRSGSARLSSVLKSRKNRPLRSAKSSPSGIAGPPKGRVTHSEQETSRSEAAYQGLLKILISGELRPNDVIMERRIAEQLQVSRTPLREAIRRLEGEKLITRQNAGTLVVSPMSTADFLNILNVRRLLEGEAVRRAASRIRFDELHKIRAQMVAVQRGIQPAGTDPNSLGRQLHELIAEAAANPVLLSIIENLGKRTRLFMRVPERRSQVIDEHLAVIDALLLRDGEAARAAMEQHIDHLRVYILDKLSIL